jgi:hypothetical protein
VCVRVGSVYVCVAVNKINRIKDLLDFCFLRLRFYWKLLELKLMF